MLNRKTTRNNVNTIYIVPIEPLDSRYTQQWYHNIPVLLNQAIREHNCAYTVQTLDGEVVADTTTPGAFLNFADTNVYKATQAAEIARLFSAGKIQPGDKFLVTDAWNFVITSIRYMSELLDIPVEIHALWHAGAYDPSDILGLKMSKPWCWMAEKSWFYASDRNYFATNFHKNMFLRNLDIDPVHHHRAMRSGQPHDPIIDQCSQYQAVAKSRSMIWPHRYNSDKQPDIVEDLTLKLDAEVVITQKLNLSKSDYYQMLGKSRVLFSCSLHENLGISVMEGVLAGVIPVLPDRCSYSEMYLPEFLYPSHWTESFEAYTDNLEKILAFIQERLDHPEKFQAALSKQQEILEEHYLNASVMISEILGLNHAQD
jgi:hypothetical protein